MKRFIARKLSSGLVLLSVSCLAVSAWGTQQQLPPPDSHTQVTLPPIVSPDQANLAKTEQMLAPIANPSATTAQAGQPMATEPGQMATPSVQSRQAMAQPVYGEYAASGQVEFPPVISAQQLMSAAPATAEMNQMPPQADSAVIPASNQTGTQRPLTQSAAGIPVYNSSTPFPRSSDTDLGTRSLFPYQPNKSVNTPTANDGVFFDRPTTVMQEGVIQPEPTPVVPGSPLNQTGPDSVDTLQGNLIPNDQVPGSGDYFSAPGTSFDNGCGNPNCIGCYGGDEQALSSQMGCCGSMMCARRYFSIDGLYMDRGSDQVVGSTFFAVSADQAAGGQFTFGVRNDVAEGREFTYWGTSKLRGYSSFTDAFARMNPRWVIGGGFVGIEDTAFRNATFQEQFFETQMHNVEFNRTRWAWDVFKSFYGIRGIYFDDEYFFTSTNVFNESGVFRMETRNVLLGAHFGSEFFYDIGYRLSTSFASKFGGYANVGKIESQLVNNGIAFLNNETDDSRIAGSIDISFQTKFQLAPRARLRAGYQAMWLFGVYTVRDNFPTVLFPGVGGNPQSNDDAVLFHGFNLGIEFYW